MKMIKLTPSDVRDVAKYLLRNGTESISVWELCKELKILGYHAHYTFTIGACVAKNSGMYVQDNHIFKVKRMNRFPKGVL